uniref:X8 domain-containing protein n=1 Tax=Picea sitchensis TaxID=3332 RepID=A9NSB1_PICSI|nr:unknown [Picea sitchensis]ABK25697.1 unknown [Picea sitchensis]
MATTTATILWPLPLLLVLMIFVSAANLTEGAVAQWCIADPQAPDDMLQSALDWVCGYGGADCSKTQPNQECFLPDNLASHASIAFNSYWQKLKHQGASCYFDSAALVTESDPSHDGCEYDFVA